MLLTLCHTWNSNLQCSDPESMERMATPGEDLLDDLLDDLPDDILTPCVSTHRAVALLTIYESGN